MKRVVLSVVAALAAGAMRVDAAGRPPLVTAVRNGDVAAVRVLLKQPNSANAAEADGTTALHWATDRDDLATAELLVRAGANVKAANRYGVTPMYSAAVSGDAAMIRSAR